MSFLFSHSLAPAKSVRIFRTKKNYTPLHLAIMNQYWPAVDAMLTAYPNINTDIDAGNGATALALAVESGEPEVIQWIEDYIQKSKPAAAPKTSSTTTASGEDLAAIVRLLTLVSDVTASMTTDGHAQAELRKQSYALKKKFGI